MHAGMKSRQRRFERVEPLADEARSQTSMLSASALLISFIGGRLFPVVVRQTEIIIIGAAGERGALQKVRQELRPIGPRLIRETRVFEKGRRGRYAAKFGNR
jgi:hypothetical protein